jgi:hypothetical protein
MAKTRYDKHNGDFSNRAHEAAKRLLYPSIFNVPFSALEFESTLLEQDAKSKLLDGQMGIDRLVRVRVDSLPAPLEFAIQERFRRVRFMNYKDLTITEWNYASGIKSELYKIKAGMFLYGYYDEQTSSFPDAICINTDGLKYALISGNISYVRRRNKKQQSFLAFKFVNLHDASVVMYRHLNKAKTKGATHE